MAQLTQQQIALINSAIQNPSEELKPYVARFANAVERQQQAQGIIEQAQKQLEAGNVELQKATGRREMALEMIADIIFAQPNNGPKPIPENPSASELIEAVDVPEDTQVAEA